MGKIVMIHLRVIKGPKILKNEDGSLANENQIVKLQYGTLSWKNYMDNLLRNGFTHAKVEKAVEMTGKYDDKGQSIGKEISIDKYDAEVQAIIKPHVKKAIKLEDEVIQLRKEMLELQEGNVKPLGENGLAIDNGSKPEVITSSDNDESGDDIKALRDEYKALNPSGKGAFGGWKADVLKVKIEAFKNA